MASASECPICHIPLHTMAERAQLQHVNSHFEEDESSLSRFANKHAPVDDKVEDERYCTKELLPLLRDCFNGQAHLAREGEIREFRFAGDTWHFPSQPLDFGWGCGYRNAQMLLSCLAKHRLYQAAVKGHFPRGVPSIRCLQAKIEEAWKEGFDPKGCEELKGKLQGTRVWIGTAEVVALLRYMGIRAHVVCVASPSGPKGTHPVMLEWIVEYFRGACTRVDSISRPTRVVLPPPPPPPPSAVETGCKVAAANCEKGLPISSTGGKKDSEGEVDSEQGSREEDVAGKLFDDRPETKSLEAEAFKKESPEEQLVDEVLPSVDLPPLFIQHKGHSRTIVGASWSDASDASSSKLFLYDPSKSAADLSKMAEDLCNRVSVVTRSLADECHTEYEIAFVQGLLSDKEIQISKTILNHTRLGLSK